MTEVELQQLRWISLSKKLETCSTLEPSLTVGNENGTHVYSSMANFEELHVGVDKTSKVYAEPSQEVGHNKPSVLVTGATAGDPEVKITFAFRIATFIVALVAKE